MSSYKKSSSSGNGGCVGVDIGPFHVTVVDLKDPTGPFHTYDYREWAAFLAGVRRGEFDLPESLR
jgi:hypothetical protein